MVRAVRIRTSFFWFFFYIQTLDILFKFRTYILYLASCNKTLHLHNHLLVIVGKGTTLLQKICSRFSPVFWRLSFYSILIVNWRFNSDSYFRKSRYFVKHSPERMLPRFLQVYSQAFSFQHIIINNPVFLQQSNSVTLYNEWVLGLVLDEQLVKS